MESRPHVLFVEDDDFSAAIAYDILGLEYEISHAVDGLTALQTIERNPPDLILLDVEMPDISGLELCRALRANTATQDMPVIFLSGRVTDQDRMAGYEAGGDDYLTKPVAAVDLRSKVKHALQLKSDVASIKQRLTQAVSTAKAVPSGVEDGMVLEFMRISLACRDYDALAREAMNTVNRYGLDASIQLRGDSGKVSRSTVDRCSPLEDDVLTNIATQGHDIDFGNHTSISYQRATIIVRNMPKQDPERYGCIKNSLDLLLAVADARVAVLDSEGRTGAGLRAIEPLMAGMKSALETFDATLRKKTEDRQQIREAFLIKLEAAFVLLGLTQSQQDEITELAQKALNEGFAQFDDDVLTTQSVAVLLDKLKGM